MTGPQSVATPQRWLLGALLPVTAIVVWQAWGIALSVEPKGGSPTGAPTGPVIFKGQCVKVM